MNPRLFCLDLYNKFELIDVSFKQVHIYIFCLPKYSNSLQATTDLTQVTDKLYHITLYRVNLASVGFKLTALVVIGTVNPTTI
jgi:hypothetical protein